MGTRLGSTIVNANGALGQPVYPLSGIVRSVYKLGQLANNYFRYAVTSDGALWRKNGLGTGSFTKISTAFSGNPCSIQSFCNTDYTSVSTAFFSDANGFFKDNGTFSAPQQGGIFPPQFPVSAAVQEPDEIVLDPARSSSYTTSGIGSFSDNYNVGITGTITAAITVVGIQAVPFSSGGAPLCLYASLIINPGGGDEETVLVIGLTATGFIAVFAKTHLTGATVEQFGWSGTVAASSTGTVALAFAEPLYRLGRRLFSKPITSAFSFMSVIQPRCSRFNCLSP